jgi:hypothetical protein
MTDAQLTALSTIAWIAGTATTFIVLAHWSAGGSWGISSAIARGLIGWTGRNGMIAGEWPSDDELGSIRPPDLDRPWAGESPPAFGPLDHPGDPPTAEIEDLGSRRLN